MGTVPISSSLSIHHGSNKTFKKKAYWLILILMVAGLGLYGFQSKNREKRRYKR